MTDRIPIADITIDPALQVREALDDETIANYAAAISRGAQFKPVILFRDGFTLRLADGFHRIKAHQAAQVAHVHATVFMGDFVDALRYAISANEQNGLRPTAGDRARAYRLAVENGLVEPIDVNGVQELLRCSERWARDLTREARAAAKAAREAEILRLTAEGKTQRETAEAVGVWQGTVTNVLREQKRKTSEIVQDPADQPPMSDEEREAWNDALKEGGQMVADFAERQRDREQAKAELSQQPGHQAAAAAYKEILGHLYVADKGLANARNLAYFDLAFWDAAMKHATQIVNHLEKLSCK